MIEYHSVDAYSNNYSDHRLEYYNANVYPFPIIDGIIQPVWSSYNSYATAIEERMAISTPYSINFNNVQGNGIDYEVTINVGQISANNVNKVLHVVLTESHIPESWYGGEEVNFVARLMVPDQFGTPLLSKPLFDFEFTLEPEWVADSCQLVAFIQDTVTKEIFQAKTFQLSDAGELSYYDIALEEIVLHANEYCVDLISPEVIINNQSNEVLESCLIEYEINSEQHAYSWMGEADQDSSFMVLLPEVSFNLLEENCLTITISEPNGEEDENVDNNSLSSLFYKSQVIAKQQLVLEILTDDFGSETSWEIMTDLGNLLASGNNYENNTLYIIPIEFEAGGCYELVVFDEGGNGMCCENGEGYYQLKDSDEIIYFEGGDFENSETSVFQIDLQTATNQLNHSTKVNIFPNPSSGLFYIESDMCIKEVSVFNMFGDLMQVAPVNSKSYRCNTSGWAPGIYGIVIKSSIDTIDKKILIK